MTVSTSKAASILGRSGGIARAKKMTPERRREIARNAALARWAKKRIKDKEQEESTK